MQVQWIGKNVDLGALSKQVELFFIEKEFKTRLAEKSEGYEIEAVSQKISNVQLKISVEILGQPNDFIIEYTADKSKEGFLSSSLIGRYIAWALGGGIIVLKEDKVREALEKFERTFWSYMDEKIAQLAQR